MFSTIGRGLGLLMGLLAIFVLAFNTYGIEPALRQVLSQATQQTGAQVEFATASGNLLTGSVSLNEVQIKKEVEGQTAILLDVGHLTADLSLLRFFDPVWQFDHLHLSGVKGDFRVVSRQKDRTPPPGKSLFASRKLVLKKGDIRFENVVQDSQGDSTRVEIEELVTTEYESKWSLYDLLFHSQVHGKVDGDDFVISSKTENGTQQVLWDLKSLPVSKWGKGLGAMALNLAGSADVEVYNSWPLQDPRKISQKWKIAVRGGLTMSFESEMARGDFEGAQSLRDAGIGEVVMKGVRSSALEGVGSTALKGVKSGLEDVKSRIGKIFGK